MRLRAVRRRAIHHPPAVTSSTFAAWAAAFVIASAAAVPVGAQGAAAEAPDSSERRGRPPAAPGVAAPRRSVSAAVRTAPIVLDGRLDDPAWRRAPVAAGFIQRYPREGIPAEEPTEVRVIVDESAIWVGARMYDSDPPAIARQLVRRDQSAQADWFEVAFDPNRDSRTGFAFRVSAANVQSDEYLYDDSEGDGTWDAVWASAVAFDSLGWTAELRIPLSQLRFRESDRAQSWGVNFTRRRVKSNEESQFALVSRRQKGLVSQFGELDGVEARAARRIELRPYALQSVYRGPVEAGNPFRTGSDAASRVGTDLRVGIGSAFALDATINPDFGQVEADPAVINLSAFEQFYEERRPFFVTDARIFDFSLSGGGNRLYYSRRLGRAPRGRPPAGALFTDMPTATDIVGAAKLTGRTQRGLSLGVLLASSESAKGRAYLSSAVPGSTFVAEPRSDEAVIRAQQEFNGGASAVGAIATAVRRDLPAGGAFDFLPSAAFNAGVDWEHQWGNRTWAFFGYFAASQVRGDSVAMIALQRASNHYLQRPDFAGGGVDSSARSLAGYDWRVTLEKRRGEHWTGSVWAAEVTPGFEVNDAGFGTRQAVLDGGVSVKYAEIRPGTWYRSYSVSLSTYHNWSHDALAGAFSAAAWGRAHVAGSVSASAKVELPNFWKIETNLGWRPETVDRSGTRGGPLMLQPRAADVRLTLRTDPRAPLSFAPSLYVKQGAMDSGDEVSTTIGATVRPSARLEVTLEPRFTRATLGAQYVGQMRDPSYEPTFGGRYFFGSVARRELSIATRVNAALSPTLSFQLFAQPLLSSGAYSDFRQLAFPGTYTFTRFGEGVAAPDQGPLFCRSGRTCLDAANVRHFDVDGAGRVRYSTPERSFNVRSLIGNAVVRWEYQPGAALFVVWQRRQRSDVVQGDFAVSRDWSALMRAPAENTFLVKLSYWLSL